MSQLRQLATATVRNSQLRPFYVRLFMENPRVIATAGDSMYMLSVSESVDSLCRDGAGAIHRKSLHTPER